MKEITRMELNEFQELKPGDKIVFIGKGRFSFSRKILEIQEESGGYLTVIGFYKRWLAYIGSKIFYTNVEAVELDPGYIPYYRHIEKYEEESRPWSYERDY
jgi:hypothetical protein